MIWSEDYRSMIAAAPVAHFSSGTSTGSSRGSHMPQNSARAVTIALVTPRPSRYSATICGISRVCSLQTARPQKMQAPCAGRSQCQQFIVTLLFLFAADVWVYSSTKADAEVDADRGEAGATGAM